MNKTQSNQFSVLFTTARNAGLLAGEKAIPAPMVVCEHSNPLDDSSPVVRRYAPILDGCCGFSWVSVKGNTAFGRWAKKAGLARPGYPNGLHFWCHDFNQSLERKEAYSAAFAAVLNANGITAYSESRMD